MKLIILFTFCLFTLNAHSQSEAEQFLDSVVTQLKTQSAPDKNDTRIYSLLESFYNEVLQSDDGELKPETAKQINSYVTDDRMKNKHLLILFLMYQEHISETAAQGKRADAEYQLACIDLLETEMQNIYGKVPTIVYIYKVEALKSAGKSDDAKSYVSLSLQKAPGSIPLKVYKYLDSKDETIRKDLAQNHSGHWMVKQFRIK